MTSVQSLLKQNSYIDSTNYEKRSFPDIERVAPYDRNPREITMVDRKAYLQKQPSLQNAIFTQGAQPDGESPTWEHTEYVTGPAPTAPINFDNGQPISQSQCSTGKCTPITGLLLPETSTMVYTDEFLNQPNANLFLQNIQPNIYSYAVDTTPINSLASGITYTPQIPPKFRDQVYNQQMNATLPIYTRVDPQLIRDQGVPARLLEQPVRNDWSSNYSSWEAAPGSFNYEDIYDPRFTGYGDPYRSYTDVNLGNVNYYYSDVDAYRIPNFISRSKVDFIEYQDPMGRVKPEYQRMAGTNDTRPFVENQWMNDTNYFRENIMESQMRKRNAELWQLRYAPQSRASHSTTTSTFS
jgi:hypothetical protein